MTPLRKIPSVMMSQHPDHVSTPYWHTQPFIETHHELDEAFRMFSELEAEEMMWDWEGKLVDDSVVERLLTKHFDFFQQKPLGKELFLTFRVPNPRVESGYRLGRAFMIILSSHHIAHSAKLTHPPLFEVILPMTESAAEMIALQQSFGRISTAATDSFGANSFSTANIEVIPIFESVETILNSGTIIRTYLDQTEKQLIPKPLYLRPFCARSDPALNSGIVPTTLAIKWALSEYAAIEQETKIAMYPIIAPGSLPFRGGLTPESTPQFLAEFSGMRTIVIQSAFRYDFPLEEVKAAIATIQQELPLTTSRKIPAAQLPMIKESIALFESPYKTRIEQLAKQIVEVAAFIPQRRERVQHIGLFGYSRQVGSVKLPRAIGFTASCYSLGIPPELLGTGMGIAAAAKTGRLALVESLYRELKPALRFAGRFFRRESLTELGVPQIAEEISNIESYLGEKLGPQTKAEEQHRELVSQIIAKLQSNQNPQPEIEQAAMIRHSLG